MKTNRIRNIVFVALAAMMALAVVAPAFAQRQRQSIVDIAVSNPDFSTLVAAVVKTGLVDALDGPRQLTVFAPTNDAFDGLAKQLGYASGMVMVEELSAEQLKPILLYHVTNGNRLSNSLFPPKSVRMFSGERAETGYDANNNPTIAGQPILSTNIRASNGIVHVIGGVMLP